MKDLATTINESCVASLKAIAAIEKEIDTATGNYNKTIQEATIYFETEKEPKSEDIAELIVNVPINKDKWIFLYESLRSEVERFKTLYLLSQATENPFKGEEETIKIVLNSFPPFYIFSEGKVVPRDKEQIEGIFRQIKDMHRNKKVLDAGFLALKDMCELEKQRASQTKP